MKLRDIKLLLYLATPPAIVLELLYIQMRIRWEHTAWN